MTDTGEKPAFERRSALDAKDAERTCYLGGLECIVVLAARAGQMDKSQLVSGRHDRPLYAN
jgi:hypothetical protein